MSYISRFDNKYISFINKKYNKSFSFFDDYIMWLYYIKCRMDVKEYYTILEKDIWEYSDSQTGTPRNSEKLNDRWKETESDWDLYNEEQYISFLRNEVFNEKTK